MCSSFDLYQRDYYTCLLSSRWQDDQQISYNRTARFGLETNTAQGGAECHTGLSTQPLVPYIHTALSTMPSQNIIHNLAASENLPIISTVVAVPFSLSHMVSRSKK